DGLSEEAVLNELAGRGLQSLLNRQFDRLNTRPEDRASFAALQAVRQLGGTLRSESQRVELIGKATAGLEKLYKNIDDPAVLERYANTMIVAGLDRDVTLLEYFGDNPVIMDRVRPAATVTVEMLRKCAQLAEKKSAELANQIKNPNEVKLIEQVEALDAQAGRTKYASNICAYYQVMGIDPAKPAGLTERQKIATPAITALKDFDNNESGVAPLVKTQIAKLHLAARNLPAARKEFGLVVAGQVEEGGKPVEMKPAPNEYQVNNAKFFLVVADIVDKKTGDANKKLTELEQWQKANIKTADPMLDASMAMLRYRLLMTESELAKGADKDTKGRDADAVLEALATKHKQFRQMVIDQMAAKMSETANLTDRNELLLWSLIQRAGSEANKPATEKSDPAVIARGLAAAKEIGRAGRNPAPTADAMERAAIFIPFILEHQKQEVEAARAYLDFGKRFPSSKNAAAAVDRAAYIVFTEYAKKKEDPDLRNDYQRVLDLITEPPYSRAEANYPAADFYRQVAKNPARAIVYYKRIPKGDKNEFNARYWELSCLNDLIKEEKDNVRKGQLAEQQAKLVDETRALAQKVIGDPQSSEPQKQAAKFRYGYLTLEVAGRYLEAKPANGKQALAVLAGFDKLTAGVTGADRLNIEATKLTAMALVADGAVENALKPIQTLIANPAKDIQASGIKLAADVEKKLSDDFAASKKVYDTAKDPDTKAKAKQDAAKAADLQTQFIAVLVPWLKANTDEAWKKKNMVQFLEKEAKLLLNAAQLTDDAARKKELLTKAQTSFDGLLKQLQAQPEPTDPAEKINRQGIESTLMFRLGQVAFELGDFKTAADQFGILVADQRVGRETTTVEQLNGGGYKEEDNPTFWEAFYKREKAVLETVKVEPDADKKKKRTDTMLIRLRDKFINFGEKAGGEKWREELLGLRAEVEQFTGAPLLTGGTPGATTAPAGAAPAAPAPAAPAA
ncbi:MAG TPA: hypothetical protein VF796_08760, partial [Humisphaera sp.]